MFNLILKNKATYLLPKTGKMKVPGLIIATEKLLENAEIEKPLEQVRNVACLPGIVGYSIAMPDIHWGYGFPIGGVAATDAESGVISPGGVGYDINCGVRLAIIPVAYKSLSEKTKQQLIEAIFKKIPSGIGHGRKNEKFLSESDYKEIALKGAGFAIEKGWGLASDLENMESNGLIKGASIDVVSETAKNRGKDQLGTVGSGNHFVEIGEVQKSFLPDVASAWGIKEGFIYLLIHSGSRGFGHQICQDALDSFLGLGYDKDLPDKQLVAAPIKSSAGQAYFSAMAAAANFAFCNRQRILHSAREAFKEVLKLDFHEIKLVYDVCHNIAKFESHAVDGKKRRLCVHRKGATRAFGKGDGELSLALQKTGQPVMVPGDMGRASYIMRGLGNPLTFSTACHGAGRAKSRIQSLKTWQARDTIAYMKNQGVLVMAPSSRTIAEEMPDAYKDVDLVVEAVQEAGLADIVARLKPCLVLKG